jgi:hypothetical protein
MNNLALLYDSQGRQELALPLFIRCIERITTVLGERHPHTLSFTYNLARLYWGRGELESALPLALACVEKRTTAMVYIMRMMHVVCITWLVYVDSSASVCLHVSTHLCIYASLYPCLYAYMYRSSVHVFSHVYISRYRCSLIVSTYACTLNIYMKYAINSFTLGSCVCRATTTRTPCSPSTSWRSSTTTKANIDSPLALYQQCLEKRTIVLGHDHPHPLDLLNNLALLYENKGQGDTTNECCYTAV